MSSFAPNWQYGNMPKRYDEESDVEYYTHFYREVEDETLFEEVGPYELEYERSHAKWQRRQRQQDMRHKEGWQ